MTTNEDHTAAAIPAPDVTEATTPFEVATETAQPAEATKTNDVTDPTEASEAAEAPRPEPVAEPSTMPAASSSGSTEQPGTQLRPRTGTIVWGVLVLAFCAFTSFQTVAPNRVDGTTFVIAAMIGIGLLLLAVGTAVVVRSARQRR